MSKEPGKIKRIAAVIGVILLLGIYAAIIICVALGKNITPLIYISIAVPVIIYVIILIQRSRT